MKSITDLEPNCKPADIPARAQEFLDATAAPQLAEAWVRVRRWCAQLLLRVKRRQDYLDTFGAEYDAHCLGIQFERLQSDPYRKAFKQSLDCPSNRPEIISHCPEGEYKTEYTVLRLNVNDDDTVWAGTDNNFYEAGIQQFNHPITVMMRMDYGLTADELGNYLVRIGMAVKANPSILFNDDPRCDGSLEHVALPPGE